MRLTEAEATGTSMHAEIGDCIKAGVCYFWG